MNKNNTIELPDNKLFKLYTLAELAYQNHFEKFNYDKEYLYPEGWYENTNYKEKIEIITESIKNNTLIENTVMYQNSIEGVKRLLVKEQK